MMVPVVVGVAAAVIFFTAGLYIGAAMRNGAKSAGRLVIDKTGDKDRWTFLLDEDLEKVENEDYIKLRIEKHG